MTEPRTPEWCQDLGTLSDRQLGLLTECAAAVIAQGAGDDADAQEMLELPAAALAPDLADALRQAGVPVDDQQIEQLCETGPSNRALAIVLLEQICAVPALRAEVDAAYTARQRLLVADPVTIAAVGLILLVMKLRRVKIGKQGLDVTLDPIRNVMTNVIKDLFGNLAMLIEAMAAAVAYDLPTDAAATRNALSSGAAVLARAGVEVPAVADWGAALTYLGEFLSSSRVIRGGEVASRIAAEAKALAEHGPVAALLPAAVLVAQWEGSSADWLFSTRRGAADWGWHGVVLPLARIMARIPALWSARQLISEAIDGMRLARAMDPKNLNWHTTEALARFRDLRNQLEREYEDQRDLLAKDIWLACRPATAPIRSGLAALWWTLGDPWHAHGVANASFKPTLNQVRRLTDQVLRRAYVDPMLSAVGSRLWQGPWLRPDRHESVCRRMVWYMPLSREYADFEAILDITGVSPSNAYARALTSFFAGTSTHAERATISELVRHVETFGGAAAIRFTALHLLLEWVDGHAMQQRWHELAQWAATVASRLNYGQPYTYDRSFDLPLYYLEGDRDYLFRSLEHHRAASMEFVLRNIRPFTPVAPRSETLLAEENQLIAEIRWLRHGSRLPRLARRGEGSQSMENIQTIEVNGGSGHDRQLALADRLRRLDEILGELAPVAPGYVASREFRVGLAADLARAFGGGPPDLDRAG